ncbi:HEM-1/HEM-2 family protein [Lysinibacillus sphaericus]|nr:HEM-1/HEM-2 family protein [Lysinibacillus sphaericus]
MFWEDLKEMCPEEREEALEYMEEFLEEVAIGNGDLNSEGVIDY